MGIPQVLMAFLLSGSVIVHICNHGKPMDISYNGVEKFIGNAIIAGILYAGGFWAN